MFMRSAFLLFSLLVISLGCPNGKMDLGEWDKQEEPEEQEKQKEGEKEKEEEEGKPKEEVPPEEPKSPFDDIPLPPVREPNPEDYNSDVDCDGIPDWEEMYVLGTDPKNRDTDGDGIWDGIEIGRYASPDPACAGFFPKNLLPPTRRTHPLRQDTDCDGVSDGDEDKNKNGRMDAGETDPLKTDTDGDSLWDGVELGVTPGMILLGGKLIPLGSPQAPVDFVCEGKSRQYAAVCPDNSRRSITNPLKADTDGDGLPDGVEDTNKDGCFDEGETDPLDANSPHPIDEAEVFHACHPDNLVPVDIRPHLAAQIALGLPMGFANSYVNIQRGTTHGLMGVDVSKNVAFVAWKHPGTLANLNALRNLATSQAQAIGAAAPTVTTFVSWDAPSKDDDNAVSVLFQISSTPHMSPTARANDIADKLLGVGVGLPLGGAVGPIQHIRAQYVRRGNGEAIVVVAVALDNDSVDGSEGYFGLKDVAGGAALARHLDRTVVQCERSVASHRAVDFLFVVDDSGSMSSSQGRLAAAAGAMVTALDRSTLDWRVAMVTSSYHTNDTFGNGYANTGIIRGFTKSAQLFKDWLTQGISSCAAVTTCRRGWAGNELSCGTPANNGCWIGTYGNGAEGMLGAARLALLDMSRPLAANNPNANVRFRDEAEIVVIILTDTEDHTSGKFSSVSPGSGNTPDLRWENVQNFVEFFRGETTTNTVPGHAAGRMEPIRPGKTIPVHAVYCPGWMANQGCSTSVTPKVEPTRIQRVVEETHGILTPITDETAIQRTMDAIVDGAIGKAGVKTQKPLIGASLRVAIQSPAGVCRTNPLDAGEVSGSNVPRSRVHGFDYDGFEQTVSFFGDCRPPPGEESRVALSYLAWEAVADRLPCEDDIRFVNDEAKGYCKDNFTCDANKDMCVCPTTPNACGGCPIGKRCDETTCVCVDAPILQ
jgi:hypothetical protein